MNCQLGLTEQGILAGVEQLSELAEVEADGVGAGRLEQFLLEADVLLKELVVEPSESDTEVQSIQRVD